MPSLRHRLAAQGATFVPTTDDWHPSFDPPDDRAGGFVACLLIHDSDGCARVIFRGADDTSLERAFPLAEARAFVAALPSVVTMRWLGERGFVLG